MNDTKYSPGTSETEDLMDGSLPPYRRQRRLRLLPGKRFSVHSAALLWIVIPCSARNAVQD